MVNNYQQETFHLATQLMQGEINEAEWIASSQGAFQNYLEQIHNVIV